MYRRSTVILENCILSLLSCSYDLALFIFSLCNENVCLLGLERELAWSDIKGEKDYS